MIKQGFFWGLGFCGALSCFLVFLLVLQTMGLNVPFIK